MKSNTTSITFDNEIEILRVIQILDYYIRKNESYDEISNTFWGEDVAEEIRPLLKTARELLHEMESIYNRI